MSIVLLRFKHFYTSKIRQFLTIDCFHHDDRQLTSLCFLTTQKNASCGKKIIIIQLKLNGMHWAPGTNHLFKIPLWEKNVRLAQKSKVLLNTVISLTGTSLWEQVELIKQHDGRTFNRYLTPTIKPRPLKSDIYNKDNGPISLIKQLIWRQRHFFYFAHHSPSPSITPFLLWTHSLNLSVLSLVRILLCFCSVKT